MVVEIRHQEKGDRTKGGVCMHEYDDAVLQCFLENQLQLFPEKVARSGSSRKLSGGMHGL